METETREATLARDIRERIAQNGKRGSYSDKQALWIVAVEARNTALDQAAR